MNLQTRSDLRSLALHREVAKKLRENKSLWSIPQHNIDRWKKSGAFNRDLAIWEEILENQEKEKILEFLEEESHEATRMRSSSPFVGILETSTIKKIFEKFSNTSTR